MHLVFDADEQELQMFLAENNDHLQSLDQNIVLLENDPDDPDLIQSIFRSAHTIKGGAGLIGHQRMAKLAHTMENVLDAVRSHTLAVTQPTIDALLAALDALRVLNDEVSTCEESEISLDLVMADLEACLSGKVSKKPATPARRQVVAPTAPAAPVVAAVPPPAPLSMAAPAIEGTQWTRDGDLDALLRQIPTDQLYDVAVAIDPACGLSAARTYQAYMELERCTRLLRITPSRQEIEADEETATLHALVATEELPSLLEHRLSQIPDMLTVQVNAVAPLQVQVQASLAPMQPESTVTPAILTTVEPNPVLEAPVAAAPQSAPPVAVEQRQGGDRRQAQRRGTDPKPAETKVAQDTSIRISVSILDNLMSLVSELVLGRTRLQTLRGQLQERYREDESVASLEDAVGHIDRVSNDLQATVMKARMLPVENVFNKFPRLMRDLAAQNGKQVTFTMSGQETELDRSVIEQLSDPLIHMLRNAIDHGLETPEERVALGKPATGSISLSATPNENHILIQVRDDGRGINGPALRAKALERGQITAEAAERMTDKEAVDLIFAPGLSTARTITNISGRGVGMDIVKAALEKMGGHTQIDTVVGSGTTFSITLPLTLAIMQALLVSVDGAVYALPLNMVTEILSVPASAIQRLQNTEATLLRGTILPLVRLREFFGRPAMTQDGLVHIVATRVDGHLLGLTVDHFIGEQEIVMKPLGRYMGAAPGLAGATILGDGRIGLLVDVAALKDWSAAAELVAA